MRKALKAALAGCLFLTGCAASAENDIELVFSDFRFQPPGNPSTVAVQEDELFLALRYGSEAGKDYLIFTSDPAVPTNGCPAGEFFTKAMEDRSPEGGECDSGLIDDFRAAFVDQADSGVWQGEGFKAYYLIQETKSMVYLVGSDDEYVKVDTDHLDADELEALVDKALLR